MSFLRKKQERENLIDYLKSAVISGDYKYQEKDFTNYLLAAVMIIMTEESTQGINQRYSVFAIAYDKVENKLYDDLYLKEFMESAQADKYYDFLWHKIDTSLKEELIKLFLKGEKLLDIDIEKN